LGLARWINEVLHVGAVGGTDWIKWC
jgi:hypothetical protein